jgi:hypothetical protein
VSKHHYRTGTSTWETTHGHAVLTQRQATCLCGSIVITVTEKWKSDGSTRTTEPTYWKRVPGGGGFPYVELKEEADHG